MSYVVTRVESRDLRYLYHDLDKEGTVWIRCTPPFYSHWTLSIKLVHNRTRSPPKLLPILNPLLGKLNFTSSSKTDQDYFLMIYWSQVLWGKDGTLELDKGSCFGNRDDQSGSYFPVDTKYWASKCLQLLSRLKPSLSSVIVSLQFSNIMRHPSCLKRTNTIFLPSLDKRSHITLPVFPAGPWQETLYPFL